MGNGSRYVTPKQLYETVTALDDKLSGKIDKVLEAVNSNRTANAGEYACLQEGLAGLRTRLEGKGGLIDRIDDIDSPDGRVARLEHSEKRVVALGGILGPIMGAIVGYLSGKTT